MQNHIRITIKRKPPKQRHIKYDTNGRVIFDSDNVKDTKILLPVQYVVKSDNWWPKQHVTDLQGVVWETDVFEYGDYYVIMMSDGSKIQVTHDGGINWHIVKGE